MTPMTVAAPQTLTIPALLAATIAARPEEPALGVIEGGELRWLSWRQLADKVQIWAAELSSRGIQPGDRVAQLSPNCEGWIIADLALQSIGAVHVPLHVSLASSQIQEQIAHSGAKLLIVGTSDLAGRIRGTLSPSCTIALHSDFFAATPTVRPSPFQAPKPMTSRPSSTPPAPPARRGA